MQDRPLPRTLVETVALLLRDTVLPQVQERTAFQVRVAINALQLVARQLDRADAGHAAELARLEALLGGAGTPADLNAQLSAQIARGERDASDERLVRHLWETTMEKLAVDQPSYAAYRDEQARDHPDTGDARGLHPPA